MSGQGSSIIPAWAVAGRAEAWPPHVSSEQAELDREELEELEALERELYADPDAHTERPQEPEQAPPDHHLHLPHLPGHGA